jgi:hypothetical protein
MTTGIYSENRYHTNKGRENTVAVPLEPNDGRMRKASGKYMTPTVNGIESREHVAKSESLYVSVRNDYRVTGKLSLGNKLPNGFLDRS